MAGWKIRLRFFFRLCNFNISPGGPLLDERGNYQNGFYNLPICEFFTYIDGNSYDE